LIMATLYNYIAGLETDGNSLVWSNNPLTASQVSSSGERPYVRVEELPERPVGSMYGNADIYQAYVDVFVYQAPGSDGRVPSRTLAMKLYFDMYDAVHNVSEWTYGQSLIAIHRDVSIPPAYDDESGGLTGMIRFRLLFPRG